MLRKQRRFRRSLNTPFRQLHLRMRSREAISQNSSHPVREIASWPVSRVLYGPDASTGTWQPFVWDDVCTSPHATHPDDWPGNRLLWRLRVTRVIPIRSCSRWGLPCRRCYQRRGGLLPHPFTLTPPSQPPIGQLRKRGGFLSVALSLGSPPPDVIRHRVSVEPGLSSPYRLSALVKRGCPANWQAVHNRDGERKP